MSHRHSLARLVVAKWELMRTVRIPSTQGLSACET